MTDEEREELARNSRNAQRLLEDEVFRKALADITNIAVQKLILADAGDSIAILRAQQTVLVCNELLGAIASNMDLHAINTRTRPV
jgi:hypothetical protein